MNLWRRVCIGVAAAVLTLPQGASAGVIDGVAATVNGKVITLLELEKAGIPLVEKAMMTTLKRERSKVKREVLLAVLNTMVLRNLQRQRAAEIGLKVNDGEVDAAIEKVRTKNSLTEEMLARAIEEEGMSWEEYREQISDQILFSRLMQQEVRARAAATPEEIETYYKEHESDYHAPERIRVRHLLVKVAGSGGEGDVKKARQNVVEILEASKGGAEFVELIRKHSPATFLGEDASSGWLRRGEFLSELEEVAFALPVGDVSDPIRSQAGFHLIQVVGKEEASVISIESATGSIVEILIRSRMEEYYNKWLEELKAKSQIEILY